MRCRAKPTAGGAPQLNLIGRVGMARQLDRRGSRIESVCPISGRSVLMCATLAARKPELRQTRDVPPPVSFPRLSPPWQHELIDHLGRTTRLGPSEARKVVDEVVSALGETTEQLVRRRHRELQQAGGRNSEIFAQIADELPSVRVVPPALSTRQLRRIVYG